MSERWYSQQQPARGLAYGFNPLCCATSNAPFAIDLFSLVLLRMQLSPTRHRASSLHGCRWWGAAYALHWTQPRGQSAETPVQGAMSMSTYSVLVAACGPVPRAASHFHKIGKQSAKQAAKHFEF